tara:strand:+ start:9403 stop:10695 length:1293 start_codon:yes stop_codon:yes gene_type:complete
MAPRLFGTSNTNMNNLNQGALSNLPSNLQQASLLATALTPARKPIDPALLSLLYFSELGKQASQPGATALGAASSAAVTPAAYLLKDRQAQADADKTRATLTASLAGSLKPKTGAPRVVNMGPAMDDGGKQKTDAQGGLLFKFNVYTPDGNVESSYEAPKTSGTTVNIDSGKKMDEEFGKRTVTGLFSFFDGQGTGQNKQPGVIDKSLKASQDLGLLNQIKSLMDKTQTGFGQSTINTGKKLLNRFGFDFDSNAIGIGENLESLSSGMVLQSVSQMKGALSDKELAFLSSMQVSLGNTKAGNYLILLSAERGIKKNLAWNQFFKDFKEENNIDPDATWNSMGSNSKENIKLAQKLQTKWQDELVKDQRNIYQFLVDDKKQFVEKLRDQGADLDTIRNQVKNKYFFTNDEGKSVDALKFIKPIFDTTIGSN